MRRARFCLLVALSTVGCATSNNEVDQARCTEARDHLIDLRLSGMTGIEVESHRTALQAALGDDFTVACTKSFSSIQLQCVLAATDYDAAQACTSNGSPAK